MLIELKMPNPFVLAVAPLVEPEVPSPMRRVPPVMVLVPPELAVHAVPAVALWVPFNITVREKVPGAKMLVDAGKPRPPKFSGWKSWAMLVLTLPKAVTRNGRARWLWIAGNRFGQVAGSVRYRTLML